jgi:imidazolonepropionase-like amidohydrolase
MGGLRAGRGLVMAMVLVCGNIFDGQAEAAAGPGEVLVDGDRIVEVAASVGRPAGAAVVDLTARTMMPGFIDSHVHLTMDSSAICTQTLASAAAKALTGLGLAQAYLARGSPRCATWAPWTWAGRRWTCATRSTPGSCPGRG